MKKTTKATPEKTPPIRNHTATCVDEKGTQRRLTLFDITPGTKGFRALCVVARRSMKERHGFEPKLVEGFDFAGYIKISGQKLEIMARALIGMAMATVEAGGPREGVADEGLVLEITSRMSVKNYGSFGGVRNIVKALALDLMEYKAECEKEAERKESLGESENAETPPHPLSRPQGPKEANKPMI